MNVVNPIAPVCPGADLPAALREHGRCGGTDWKWYYAPDWEGTSESYVLCMSDMCGQSFKVQSEIAQDAIENARSAYEIAQAAFAEPGWERYERTEYDRATEACRESRRKSCSQLVSHILPYTNGHRNGNQWLLGGASERCDGIIMHGGSHGGGIDTEPPECDECGTRYDLDEYWDEAALCPRHGYRLGRGRPGPDNSPRVCHVCESEELRRPNGASRRRRTTPDNGAPPAATSNPRRQH